MAQIAIRVEGLGKQYFIGRTDQKYRMLRETLMDTFTAPLRYLRGERREARTQSFWALQDVSFEVAHGQAIGIIGHNGAGKSTLLKLLSRITKPSRGVIYLNGRVGSLLEVGTGFHPELTGRENVYLNGAVLGMTRQEISRKFDEIIAFAEVEQFVDTPVKRYSSGMGLRLGFAVAAHLETEILLVDEVLAVGDTNFQKRCLGKMQDVTNQGRTVLFVSHSMPAIRNLCQQAVVLAHGREIFDGEVNEAITFYMQRMDNTASGVVDLKDASRLGTGEMRLLRFWVEDETHQIVSSVPSGKRCFLAVEYVSADGASRRDVSMSIVINTVMGSPVTLVNTNMLNQNFEVAPPQGIIRLELPRLPLTAGRYLVDLNLATHGGLSYADFLKAAAAFIVEDGDYYGTGRPGNPGAPVIFDGRWYIGEEHTYSW